MLNRRNHRLAIVAAAALNAATISTADDFQTLDANPKFTDRFAPLGVDTQATRVNPMMPSAAADWPVSNSDDFTLAALAPSDIVEDAGNPIQNGRVYPIDRRSDLDGAWHDLPGGARLWSFTIGSPNAAGLRVRLSDFRPARGARLFMCNADSPAESVEIVVPPDGPAAEQWSPVIFGRRARLEYLIPANVEPVSREPSPIHVTGVVQIFPYPEGESAGGGCRLDWRCYPAWADDGQGVAHIQFVSGGGNFICSGALVNRLPSFDGCPLFLTANHCIGTESEANSVVAFWFFQSASCNGSVPPLNSVPQTVWSTLLTRDISADNSLLGLTPNQIPGGVFWLGWITGEVPDGAFGAIVHHPLGMRKSYSWGNVFGIETISQCSSPISDTYDFELDNGGQDGGSSGAPMFDSNHRIRAVVTCSESDNCIPAEDCGEGSFHHSYAALDEYLDAASVVYVNIGAAGVEDGSATFPWNTIREGFYGVHGGGTIMIAPGNYPLYNIRGPRGMRLQSWGGGAVRIGG
ncbi:MAG: hypothetical protein JNG88_06015 [Phycisphaerales bacterium]|nr:hypothetical protein [Phycisphaerales bacterium]